MTPKPGPAPRHAFLVTGPNASGKTTAVRAAVAPYEGDPRLRTVHADHDDLRKGPVEQMADDLERIWREDARVLIVEGIRMPLRGPTALSGVGAQFYRPWGDHVVDGGHGLRSGPGDERGDSGGGLRDSGRAAATRRAAAESAATHGRRRPGASIFDRRRRQGMARRGRGRQPKKPKRIPYELIDRETGRKVHQLVSDLVHEHHAHLRDATIALAWHRGWKPDVDGRVTLGMCRKASDIDRLLKDYDFLILLNRDFWTNPAVTDDQRAALVDHELCHAEVVIDPVTNDPHVDVKGRTVYRIRRHDIEEFGAIVERHGCYKRDLENFAAALLRGPQRTLFEQELTKDAPRLVPGGGVAVN